MSLHLLKDLRNTSNCHIGHLLHVNTEDEKLILRIKWSPSSVGHDLLSLGPAVAKGTFSTLHICTETVRDITTVPIIAKVTRGHPERIREEIVSHSRIPASAPHVARLYAVAVTKDVTQAVLFLEQLSTTTLHDVVRDCKDISGPELLRLCYEMISAIHEVSSMGVVHRDLKLHNFVFTIQERASGHLKLIDFGLASSVVIPKAGDIQAGTIMFMPPEMASNIFVNSGRSLSGCSTSLLSIGLPADIWSLGIALLMLVSHTKPYPYDPNEIPATKAKRELLERIARGKWNYPTKAVIRALGRTAASHFEVLIRFMLMTNPSTRPNSERVRRKFNRTLKRYCSKSPESVILSHLKKVKPSSVLISPRNLQMKEKVQRKWLHQLFLLQQKLLHDYIRVLENEDLERFNMTWLHDCAQKYARHPHRFTLRRSWPRGYANGFTCDSCYRDFPKNVGLKRKRGERSTAPPVLFYSCSCGMDLCPTCAPAYFKSQSRRKAPARKTSRPSAKRTVSRKSTPIQKRRDSSLKLQEVDLSPLIFSSETTPDGKQVTPWDPFRSSSFSEDSSARRLSTIQQSPLDPSRPSPEELEWLVGEGWIRHFRFICDDPTIPTCFAYHVEEGRFGAIFSDFSNIIHSVVLSTLEEILLLVISVDLKYPLKDALELTRVEDVPEDGNVIDTVRSALRRIAVEDMNKQKVKIPPGIMSICPSPLTLPSVATEDTPIYVRWIGTDTQANLTFVLLSNGFGQIFGSEFELRFHMDSLDRIFLVRYNVMPICVELNRFPKGDAIKQLLEMKSCT